MIFGELWVLTRKITETKGVLYSFPLNDLFVFFLKQKKRHPEGPVSNTGQNPSFPCVSTRVFVLISSERDEPELTDPHESISLTYIAPVLGEEKLRI